MSDLFLWLIILIEGFVTISAEILTIRQLLPLVGNSVIVTSLIIGVFLLFLAYGYRRGGQYKGNYAGILKRNFTLSAFWLGLGLSYIFISLFFSLSYTKLGSHILLSLTAYLLLVTAPLVYILGQTVPITMNLMRSTHSVGGIGGKVLHLSTVGSFLGSVFTSLILMQLLGVAWTVFVNYGLLMLLTFLLITERKKELPRILLLVIGLALTYAFNVFIEKKLFVATNAYANYEVVTDQDKEILLINDSPSSSIDRHKKAFPYVEHLKQILFDDLKLKDKEILILGAGGFSLSAENPDSNHFTYVDIDPDLEQIVKKSFLETIPGKVLIQDARVFLDTTPSHFDVIISDAYSHARSIPAQLLTQEYFATVNKTLKNSGLAIFNIIANPFLQDDYSKRVDNTIRSVFSDCMVIPLRFTDKITNILYVCQKNKACKQKRIYSDDLTSSTLDYFQLTHTLGSKHENPGRSEARH